jgi:hypothetical protein
MPVETVDALDTHLAELLKPRRRPIDARTIESGERVNDVPGIAASAERLTGMVHAHRRTASEHRQRANSR